MEIIKNIYKVVYKNRKFCMATLDLIIIIVSYIFSQFLILESTVLYVKEAFIALGVSLLIAIIVYEIFFISLKIYSSITRYENGKDYLTYIFISCVTSIITALIELAIYKNIGTLRINFIAGILIAMSMVACRIVIRLVLSNKGKIIKNDQQKNIKQENVLIIGAGSSARDIIKIVKEHMNHEYNIVGMVDDNINKIKYNISSVKVLGDRKDIQSICKKFNVDLIFFTISKISARDRKAILDLCQKTGAKLRILPSTEDYIKSNKNLIENLKDVEIEDILYRDPVVLDNNNISKLIEDNVILVTGGGGSIGSELCRQIMTYNPKKLVIVDIYENNLYDIEIELKSKYKEKNIEALVASVREKKAMEMIFKKYNPELVFHAAAHKHVPLMENSPAEAIKNNIFGTNNIVNLSDKYNVKRFVLISSDKAVNPTNVMGATKRLCEMIIQAKNKISKTEFSAVRFGNVLGSNGSVIPLFKKQIEAGGPITVTHKNITRYFMTITEAVQLVIQAITYAKGGEIFVLDMGEPVKIYDLAVSLIKLSGLEPDVDIPIEVVGLRPGEKLYEELLMDEEGIKETNHEKIFVTKPSNITVEKLEEKLLLLQRIIEKDNFTIKEVKEALKATVKTYKEIK